MLPLTREFILSMWNLGLKIVQLQVGHFYNRNPHLRRIDKFLVNGLVKVLSCLKITRLKLSVIKMSPFHTSNPDLL